MLSLVGVSLLQYSQPALYSRTAGLEEHYCTQSKRFRRLSHSIRTCLCNPVTRNSTLWVNIFFLIFFLSACFINIVQYWSFVVPGAQTPPYRASSIKKQTDMHVFQNFWEANTWDWWSILGSIDVCESLITVWSSIWSGWQLVLDKIRLETILVDLLSSVLQPIRTWFDFYWLRRKKQPS